MPPTRRSTRRSAAAAAKEASPPAARRRTRRRAAEEEEEEEEDEEESEEDDAPRTPRGASAPRTPSPGRSRRRSGRLMPAVPPKTPPHFRKNALIKSGYCVYVDESDSFETLTEVNTETASVYTLLAGAAAMVLLWVNFGWAVEFAGVEYNNVYLNTCVLGVLISLATKAMYHLFCQIPSRFSEWSARSVVADGIGAGSLVAALAATGHVPQIPGVPALTDETRQAAMLGFFLVHKVFVIAAYALQRRSASAPRLLNRVVAVAVAMPFVLEWAYASRGDPLALSATVCFAISDLVDVLKIPERFAERTFDKVGHSQMISHAFLAIGYFQFFAHRWHVATGRGDLVWVTVFC